MESHRANLRLLTTLALARRRAASLCERCYIGLMHTRAPTRRRRLRHAVVAIAPLFAGCHSSRPASSTPVPVANESSGALDARVRERIAQVPGAVVGIYYRNLGRAGDTLTINADSVFHAASTMKVGVMIQLFRDVDAGKLSLDRQVTLQNRFSSIIDGSPYTLDPKDDSDSSLYLQVGQPVAIRELLDRMIERSSNLATNTVIEIVGAQRTDSTVHALGATHMQVLRGVEDLKAFDAGRNNVLSARDLGTLLAAIQDGRAATPASCEQMRQILLAQEFSTEIPAGLPPGTPVAHKTGWITSVLHDAAIVYPRSAAPYILVVLTRGIPDEHVAQHLIADISRSIYQHATGTPQKVALDR
jgi:beta-lactamase class A